MTIREETEEIEEKLLATYATKSRESQGRKHEEDEDDSRTAFQRDRDRIIHSTAFRRLQYKTQVFVNHEGDYYRTRLTHTLEVMQIARSIARMLRLNEDLTEAIALAHDLGHTPFGHAGEKELDKQMKRNNVSEGFEHNRQSYRILTELEIRYPNFAGLNVSYEVRQGLAMHRTGYDNPVPLAEFKDKKHPSLEAQIVDIADEIAFNTHDLDDGLACGLVTTDQLSKSNISIWDECWEECKAICEKDSGIARRQAIRRLINKLVTDAVSSTNANIKKTSVKTSQDVMIFEHKLVEHSGVMQKRIKELSGFLYSGLYRHPQVLTMTQKGSMMIEKLFVLYTENRELLPLPTQGRIQEGQPLAVIVADYISGMTDRYAMDRYKQHFEPYERVLGSG